MEKDTNKFKVVQEALNLLNNNISQFELDFYNDFKQLNLRDSLLETTYILPRDIQYVCEKMNYIVSSLSLVFLKHDYSLKSSLYKNYEDEYWELLQSYNKIFTSLFNPRSKEIYDSYDYEKATTPTGLPWGIITSSTADYIAYAVLDTFHAMSQERGMYNKYKYKRDDLRSELEKIWSDQFENKFMPAFKKCNEKAVVEIMTQIFDDLNIERESYNEWEKNNPFVKVKKKDYRRARLEEVKIELNSAEQELMTTKKPLLGLFGNDREKRKVLKEKIKKLNQDIINLQNNKSIPNTPFVLGEVNLKNARKCNSKEYYLNAFQKIEYDEERHLYIITDDEVGELGSLKQNFVTQYGSYRSFVGSGFTDEWESEKPAEYTHITTGSMAGYATYLVSVHEK